MVAIGNAGGTGGTPSNADGSIVALNQSITASDSLDGASEQLSGLIQVNAGIMPGDSGGSLVNTAGQVIGIDTAASQSYSLQSSGTEGFAIPIDQALAIAQQIESGQGSTTVHVGSTASLGVLLPASDAQSSPGNFFGNGWASPGGSSASGPTVSSVVSGGPAAQAGLAPDDVITSRPAKASTPIPRSAPCWSPTTPATKSRSGGLTPRGSPTPLPSSSAAGLPPRALSPPRPEGDEP